MRHPFLTFVLTSAIALSAFPLIAHAHHRPGHQGGPPHSRDGHPVRTEPVDQAEQYALALPLTDRQRRILIEILRDGNDNDTLISRETRRDIQNQLNTLPPGIQRQLERGRSLPPGIAKKITLPYRLNNHLDLDENVRIVVAGPDVVVIDPVTDLIVDVLRDILL